jgi:transcriptional regulator with XRE-family HTH domain
MNYAQIKILCRKNGLTLNELADQISYTRQGLQLTIKNETIQLRKLRLIRKILKVKPIELL